MTLADGRKAPKILKIIAILLGALAFGSCGSDTTAAGAPADSAADSANAEIAQLDAIVADVSVGVDAAVETLAAPDGEAVDAVLGDVQASPDAAKADVSAVCPGAPACTCKENNDCDNAQCIEIGTGKVCATPCVDKCEAGFKCALVNGGGDAVTICVPKFIHLCDPCAKSKDCQSVGNADAACVNQGAHGNFCATGCVADSECPIGDECHLVNSVEGAAVTQCVPAAQSKGGLVPECVCSAKAITLKLQTSCFVEHKNEKGELIGKCAGVRQCETTGLTACAAPVLDVEVCDGKDNDCDGKTDEETCNSGSVCSVGVCDGQNGCQFNKLNNIACDADQNSCTENDQCKLGVCVPGQGKLCDDGNPCTSDSCDAAKGCTNTVDDGKLCDFDGDACTNGDHCAGSVCTAGKPIVCNSANACVKSSCDTLSGKCAGKALQDGGPCDDGSVCTAGDHCQAGECTGKIVSCDDNNPCTGDSCDIITGCKSVNLDGIACDDDNPCTNGDLCNGAVCNKGLPKVCESGVTCIVGGCNLNSGKCDFKFKPSGTPCNDGDACSQGDNCQDGNCSGKPNNCDDSNPCTDDTCDSKIGCGYAANTSPCSDGDACTQNDKCANSLCAIGPIKVCDDGIFCTADSCDKASGACNYASAAMNGAPCDDNSVCTIVDACVGGFCVGGFAKNCDDANVCTDDLCDKLKGCNPSFNVKVCDDGNACTKGDTCKVGDCEGNVVKCDDSNLCTNDACDPKKGCVYTANGVGCDDNNACTNKDACTNAACGGVAINCDDGSVCSDDSCDKLVGCVHTPNVALCPDNDACTTAEQCNNLNCVKKAVVCDDLNVCTKDSCDAAKGCQVANVADNTPCDDGGICTAGKCTAIGTQAKPGASCAAILAALPNSASALYWLDPDGAGGTDKFQTWCDMKLNGGGWTLIAIVGQDARPGAWKGGAFPRPGATFYGPAASDALGDILVAGKNDAGVVNFSISAKDLFANSAKREVIAYVGGSKDDYVTVALPKTCNPFDPTSNCQQNTVTGLKVLKSDGQVLTSNGQMCNAPADNCGFNEFSFHLLDGNANGGCTCHQADANSGSQGIGRIWTSFNRSDGGYWNSGVHSSWSSDYNQPGALLFR